MRGFPNEWWYDSTNSTNEESAIILNEYNKLVTMNNPKKFIILLSLAAGYDSSIDNNNTQERIALGKYFLESYRKFQFSAFVWDNGFWNNSADCDDIFRSLKMDSLEWKTP